MKRLLLILSLLTTYAIAQGGGLVNGSRGFPAPNDPGGTTLHSLATITPTGTALLATTGSTAVPVYIVIGGAGTSGTAVLASSGTIALCTMDANTASAGGYYVIASVTNAGYCHPQVGLPSAPLVGILLASSTTSGQTALVAVGSNSSSGSGGGLSPGTAGQQVVTNPGASALINQTKAVLDVRDVTGINPAGNSNCNRNVTTSGCVDSYSTLQAFFAAQCPGSTYSPGPTIVLPQNTNTTQGIDYYSSQPLLLPRGCHLEGTGTGRVGRATTIAFAAGQAGFVCQSGCVIKHFYLLGGNSYTSGSIPTILNADGIQAGSSTQIEDVGIQGFGRHGIMAASDLASGFTGWPTQFDAVVTTAVISSGNLGDGFHFSGSDGATGVETDAEAYNNQGTGIWDTSLYGNLWNSPLTTGNATRAYWASSGAKFVAPYAESETVGDFCGGTLICTTVSDPQGLVNTQLSLGVAERPWYTFKEFTSGLLVVPASSISGGDQLSAIFWSGQDGDNHGLAPIEVQNVNPANPINNAYSTLLFRRTRYVSSSSADWWCWMKSGSYTGTLATSSACSADDLTNTGRSAITASSLFPNGFFIGASGYSGINYFGVGTSTPVANSWSQGDWIINSTPVQGAPFGYRNYSGGTPGSWETLSFNPAVNPLAFSGADNCAKIAAAGQSLNGLTRGGVVDARAITGTQTCASNPFSGVTAPVKFIFGGATWNTTAQWNLCNTCVAEGPQWSAMVVVAVTGFPTGTAILNIGDGSNTFFDTRFNHFQADCGNTPIVGCYGFQGQGIDEGSGASFLRVRNCNAANGGQCVAVNSPPSTSNFTMDHIYILYNTSATTTADGILVSGTSSQGTWDAVTVIGAKGGPGSTTGTAFHCSGTFTGCKVRSLHAEAMNDVAYFSGNSWGSINGATGDPTMNSGAAVVHIATTNSFYGVDYSDLFSVNTTYLVKTGTETISGAANSGNVTLAHGVYPSLAVETITDNNGNPFISVSPTASAVDGVTVTNAATGSPATVSIAASGSDSNININLVSKGTGQVLCNGAGCGGGGSGTIVAEPQFDFGYYSGAGTNTQISGANWQTGYDGVPQLMFETTSGGINTTPTTGPAGVPVRASTCSGNVDSVVATDRGTMITETDSTATCVITLAQAGTTGFDKNFVTLIKCVGTFSCTLLATTSTIDGVAGATGVPIEVGASRFIYTLGGNYNTVPVAKGFGGINTQMAAYTATIVDKDQLIVMNCASACALTLPATPPTAKWNVGVMSIGAALATVSLNSLTYNGGVSVPALIKYMPIKLRTDGSNYFGDVPLVAGTGITLTPAANGVTITATGGSGTVTSIATTSPITGGTITTTGTIACATCVTSAAPLTNNQLVFGAGSQASAVGDLTGDVTTSGGKATTVVQVEGAAIPVSAAVVATNSSKQLIAATAVQVEAPRIATSTGSANAYVLALSPAITTYTGFCGEFISNFANTGAATINISTLGAKSITKNGAAITALASGDIGSGQTVSICYDGAQMEMMSQPGNVATQTVASGTAAMGTSAVSSGTCAAAVTVSATGVATTDRIVVTPNGDPTIVTGYGPSAAGSLYIQAYPTVNNVNFKVCNDTSASITPSALTLNWGVMR